MAKTPKTLQVSFGGFSCTLEGFDDPLEGMRAVTEYLRDLSARDPSFADRIGLAVPRPLPAQPAPEALAPVPPATPTPPATSQAPAPPAAPPPKAAPEVLAPLLPDLPPQAPAPDPILPSVPAAPDLSPFLGSAPQDPSPEAGTPPPPETPEPLAEVVSIDAPEPTGDEADSDSDEPVAADSPAHPGLHRLLSATPEREEEELSRIMSLADDQLADPEAARRRGVINQLKAAVAATEADRALGEAEPGPQARQGAFRLDLSEAVRSQAPVAARPEQAPLRLVASQRVDSPPEADLDEEDEDEQDSLPVRRPGSFRVFASEMSAISLPDLLEAAAAWLCFVDERESVSRAQLLSLAAEALDAVPEREEGLRAFGLLLREGRVAAVAGGRYRVSEGSRFHPGRLAG